MFRTDCCNVYDQNLVRNLKVVRGGLGEHRGMESENEEVNEIVESNGLKVEQLPLNIDNCGEGKDMMSKENAVVSSSVNNPLKEVVELLVEMTNREVTEQKRSWCHYGHFRVGPHVLTFPAIEDEWKLIGYIINEHLDGREYHLWLRLRQTAKAKKVQTVHLPSFFPPTLRLVIVIVNA
ncbi:hypothetical protein WN944_029515 [Citrus x changshan-huyou]|uniref:Uncharacterized protein n=1 Tax=Citrus x changshan-huyou TaxID=2935761 RepID=A0AAP0LMF1_9ROSI